jgi:FAD/FMN-containing dehydrogenase
MPSYPASRELCTIGGMVNNNSGGEKSLEYGKTENFVTELNVVLADGNAVTMGPLTKRQLDAKMKLKTFEGEIYRKTFELVDTHYDAIKKAKPHVTKNSTGYNLWDVWDRETGIFDLTKLIVGAQGTLGLTTDIQFRLVPHRPHSGLLVLSCTTSTASAKSSMWSSSTSPPPSNPSTTSPSGCRSNSCPTSSRCSGRSSSSSSSSASSPTASCS